MLKYCIIVMLIVFPIVLFSQNISKYIRNADKCFNAGNYYGAQKLYEKALSINSDIIELHYKYAEACRLNRNYELAEKSYKKVLSANVDNYPLAEFWYAEVLKSQGKYQKAQRSYRNYYKLHKTDTTYYYIQKAEHELYNCEQALLNTFNIKGIDLVHMDTAINTIYSELNPVELYDTLLYFSSIRPQNNDSINLYSKLYLSVKRDSQWIAAYMAANFNTDYTTQTGNITFSPDYRKAFFSQNSYVNEVVESKIYVSEYNNDEWQKPVPLPDIINIPGAYTTHPCYVETPKGAILLFSSNRQGGYGRMDIWFSVVDAQGNFEEPENLGPQINSIDDEVTPFYTPYDSTIYFSSRWHDNFGGFDIFKSKGDFFRWQQPENLGIPINSSYDDLYYYINRKATRAYFSSNRLGSFTEEANKSCCNDIYWYKLGNEPDSVVERLKTKVILNEMQLLVPITLYFHNDEPNPRTTDTTTNVNYQISVLKYLTMQDEYRKQYSSGLSPREANQAINDIDNFFTDYVRKGYDDLLKFTEMLEHILNKGETVVITLKGYTSPLNTTEYNTWLAKRRIRSLVNFFNEYNNGVLLPYMNDSLRGGKRLIIEEVAIGEELSDKNVSDDRNDVRNSVYSPAASLERKIKIIAVKIPSK